MMDTMSFKIHIDSRDRDEKSGVNNASFLLSKSLCNVTGCRIKWVQLANTLVNVDSSNNRISISTNHGVAFTDYDITSLGSTGFVDSTLLLQGLTDLLASISPASTVTIDTTNRLNWNLASGVLINGATSSARHILGFSSKFYADQFKSSVFLATPYSISFICPQLQSIYNVFSNRNISSLQPFVTVPVTVGYGEIIYHEPNQHSFIKLSNIVLSSLDIRVVDTRTGSLITDCGPWAMELEVFV